MDSLSSYMLGGCCDRVDSCVEASVKKGLFCGGVITGIASASSFALCALQINPVFAAPTAILSLFLTCTQCAGAKKMGSYENLKSLEETNTTFGNNVDVLARVGGELDSDVKDLGTATKKFGQATDELKSINANFKSDMSDVSNILQQYGRAFARAAKATEAQVLRYSEVSQVPADLKSLLTFFQGQVKCFNELRVNFRDGSQTLGKYQEELSAISKTLEPYIASLSKNLEKETDSVAQVASYILSGEKNRREIIDAVVIKSDEMSKADEELKADIKLMKKLVRDLEKQLVKK